MVGSASVRLYFFTKKAAVSIASLVYTVCIACAGLLSQLLVAYAAPESLRATSTYVRWPDGGQGCRYCLLWRTCCGVDWTLDRSAFHLALKHGVIRGTTALRASELCHRRRHGRDNDYGTSYLFNWRTKRRLLRILHPPILTCPSYLSRMATPTAFADYHCVVTDIDRKKYGRRVTPMKVLMLGMGRTGTECAEVFQSHCSSAPC